MAEGIRPCLSATNQWLGCPYPDLPEYCPATRKVLKGETLLLDCVLKAGYHDIPEGYYPPKPRVAKVLAAAKQTDAQRRARHTNALTVKKRASKTPASDAAPLRVKQYVNGAWVTRVFQNGVWTDEPAPDRQPAQPTAQ